MSEKFMPKKSMPEKFTPKKLMPNNSTSEISETDTFVARNRWDVIAMFVGTTLVTVTLVPWWGFAVGYHSWTLVLFVVFVLWNSLSITAGYHRLWSHRAYKAHVSIRLLFALGGALSFQNSIKEWCSGHRNHHRYTDDPELDPYAATRGFWYSHIGWMLKDYRSEELDYANIKDLEKDAIVNWQHKYYLQLALFSNIGFPLIIGSLYGDALGALLLAGFLRLVFCHHTTFFINSLAHLWGKQPYSDANTSKDNSLIAFFTFGEGYHNFHHSFQWDYRNGIKWYQFDPTKWLVGFLSWLKLADELKRTDQHKIELSLAKMQLKKAKAGLNQITSLDKIAQLGAQLGAQFGARFEEQFGQMDREALIAVLHKEYDELSQAISEWAQVKQQWLQLQRDSIKEKWEKHELKGKLDELEEKLDSHRRSWRLLTAQFA